MKASDRYFIDGVFCSLHGRVMPVANLSVGGLFAASEDPPMPGQMISLDLTLGRRPPFKVVGMVTWINQPESPRAAHLPKGFGVKITKIEFPDKLAILDLLKRNDSSRTRDDA